MEIRFLDFVDKNNFHNGLKNCLPIYYSGKSVIPGKFATYFTHIPGKDFNESYLLHKKLILNIIVVIKLK